MPDIERKCDMLLDVVSSVRTDNWMTELSRDGWNLLLKLDHIVVCH
jgi:hypothetical protein